MPVPLGLLLDGGHPGAVLPVVAALLALSLLCAGGAAARPPPAAGGHAAGGINRCCSMRRCAGLDLAAIAVFAASGALVASRKGLDAVGFVLIGVVTGLAAAPCGTCCGGRTPPSPWLRAPELPGLAGPRRPRGGLRPRPDPRAASACCSGPMRWGCRSYAVLGTEAALVAGADPWAAALLGVVTATFGGVARDVICNEVPLILRREIYATAAAAGAVTFVMLRLEGVWREPAFAAGILVCFTIRAAALLRGWSLPATANARGAPTDVPHENAAHFRGGPTHTPQQNCCAVLPGAPVTFPTKTLRIFAGAPDGGNPGGVARPPTAKPREDGRGQ
jgi:uncharacterized membrane protein YeiH